MSEHTAAIIFTPMSLIQVDLDPAAGLTADFIYGKYREWVADLSVAAQHALFIGTAEKFYRL